LAHHAEREPGILRKDAQVFARGHAKDVGCSRPPHAGEGTRTALLANPRALLAKGLFHIGAEFAAEIEREQAQQGGEKTVGAIGFPGRHRTAPVSLSAVSLSTIASDYVGSQRFGLGSTFFRRFGRGDPR